MNLNGLNIINLTPHEISFSGVIDGRPQMLTLEPEPVTCRVETEQHATGMIGGLLPTQCQTYGRINNLPAPKPNTVYVVSGLVLHALKLRGEARSDVVAPATGPRDNALRNANGHVLAVTVFNTMEAA